jgi:crotonobetainyl-CoA:carnitine CoA-transferase CaiB-like acyl-CoA transferase
VTKPLEGIRVIEVAIYAFAPSAAAILVDWGADVIKVEHPTAGDPGRSTAAWGVPADVNGISHLWEAVNRGKRAVALDIATPEGNEILMRLVDDCDVFICNFLPAARRKLGIDADDIIARNPNVVYARGSAQGPRGALAERGGFDGISYWGRSGAAIGVTPPSENVPLAMPGPGFGDLQSGVALAGGISAALFHRERTGRGVVVDGSLLASGLWAMGMTISGSSVIEVERLPHQYHHDAPNPAVNYYRTKDDEFVALAFLQADRYWPEFCVLVDRLDWLADERFGTADARRENSEACVNMLSDLFAEHTLAEWQDLLSRQEGQWDVLLPAGRVQHDQQALDNGYVQRIEHDQGSINLVAAPIQFDGEAPELGRAPRLGADTRAILLDQGFDASAIDDLVARRVIRCDDTARH